MKFGKTFLSHQIPEWSIFYMNYKNLKKIIKNIDYDFNPSEMEISDMVNSILTQFFYQLDGNIEKVDTFYSTKFDEYNRRLNKIINLLNFSQNKIHHQIDSNDELDEIISILLELKNFFRNLKWFGELNHKGFVKILKKLDKKMVSLTNLSNTHLQSQLVNLPSNNKEVYLSTRVNALPFANEIDLHKNLDLINNLLNQLSYHDFASKTPVSTTQSVAAVKDKKTMDAINSSFDSLFLTSFKDLIASDDPKGLLSKLERIPKEKKNLKFLITLLGKLTISNAIGCIDLVFGLLDSFIKENNLSTDNLLYDKFDINGRNFFHLLVVSYGKQQLSDAEDSRKASINQKLIPGENNNINKLYLSNSGIDGNNLKPIILSGFEYILEKISAGSGLHNLKFLLNAKDNYLRTPLHYASQYGIKDMVKLILSYLFKWNLINNSLAIDDNKFWVDQENLTPIHLSIIGKHPKTTEYLLIYSNTDRLTCSNLLLLAVRLNSPEILSHLIKLGRININYTDFEHNNETALYIAAKLNLPEVVEFLLNNSANPEIGEMIFGWTPIFVAASEGFESVVNILLQHNCHYDLVDESGWLPMEHASLRGHLAVADLLKPKNEQLLFYDISNHENNLQRVPASSIQNPTSNALLLDDSLVMSSTSSIDILPESNKNAVNEVYKQLKQFDNSSQISVDSTANQKSRSKSPMNVKRIKPIKSFGHTYLNNDESLVLITLGTTDLRDDKKPIELNDISLAKTYITELDTALSLVITCRNKLNNESIEPPVVIDLPLEDHHGSATDPITFKLTNNLTSSDVIVTFDIVPTYQYNQNPDVVLPLNKEETILGRAVALLGDVYTNVGPKLRSLHSVVTSPIIESRTLNVLGSVRFEFLCVKSFNHPNMKIGRTDTYWKQLVSTRVIGHRGLGKNVSNKKSLQLGENTVESFIAAASLGASYVEFDVQLTKDSVPVIYHDFLVAESGVDIPMHTLTAEQFLHLNDNEPYSNHKKQWTPSRTNSPLELADTNGTEVTSLSLNSPSVQSPKIQPYAMDDEILSKRSRSKGAYKSVPNMAKNHHLHQSFSHGDHESDDDLERELQDQHSRRMKLTKTWKDKGFKGNARGLSIASDFVTLKDLFRKLPRNVGFNIEVKYPMLDEAQEESMGDIAYDVNHYVDTILQVVYDENLTGRDIILSSFHPDVCLMLSLKQPTIPILYLTEAGTHSMADIRASSLQNAIRFAKKWNLLGIVSAAETLVKTPRLAQVIKSSGLVCVTYGVLNNSPENCKIQMKAGVDAVIVDSVLAVREGIRKDVEKANSESEASSVY
ncbi:Glycerophosphocholine phosphodiesterase [Yamadazyma tenuis]|uniref:GDPD-domain-containing protein n=1 Tax=Candida tenuis (strain ATCC 10573 / BCRC 21748 / CBS 615 / JCM 9827 / NBRC 10315 / NRRL Y-1498 / VKM Y-70) TaxID=590646 RepID=G3BDC5_CANTC|nr:uncharacterized protein CANTEDRAFT_137394 [Yamadazyma tenuis ATCC 10573]EGV60926.1 hypothetical protein CANTEDRAFT_137394 [Yamadazyma tenuis ATCC 10573]WEJ93800.1 Glycerophosphocholine phosphodiesterase [Yamadazyma tenuis]